MQYLDAISHSYTTTEKNDSFDYTDIVSKVMCCLSIS